MWPFRRKPNTPSEKGESASLGSRGERLARRFLRQMGLHILATNYRCSAGEADLVALDRAKQAIVFVEVKTRRTNEYTAPYSAVNATKRRRLKRIAREYFSTRDTEDLAARFDVISIVIRPGEPPDIRHIPDAF